jgi:hypothetical protein
LAAFFSKNLPEFTPIRPKFCQILLKIFKKFVIYCGAVWGDISISLGDFYAETSGHTVTRNFLELKVAQNEV